ncbi:hypothetical protein ACVL91_007410 [Bradyrhizobium elkanii]
MTWRHPEPVRHRIIWVRSLPISIVGARFISSVIARGLMAIRMAALAHESSCARGLECPPDPRRSRYPAGAAGVRCRGRSFLYERSRPAIGKPDNRSSRSYRGNTGCSSVRVVRSATKRRDGSRDLAQGPQAGPPSSQEEVALLARWLEAAATGTGLLAGNDNLARLDDVCWFRSNSNHPARLDPGGWSRAPTHRSFRPAAAKPSHILSGKQSGERARARSRKEIAGVTVGTISGYARFQIDPIT